MNQARQQETRPTMVQTMAWLDEQHRRQVEHEAVKDYAWGAWCRFLATLDFADFE